MPGSEKCGIAVAEHHFETWSNNEFDYFRIAMNGSLELGLTQDIAPHLYGLCKPAILSTRQQFNQI